MKTFFSITFALTIAFGVEAASCPPVLIDFPDLELDIDQDGNADLLYSRWIDSVGGSPNGQVHSQNVGYGVLAQNAARLVRSADATPSFSSGQTISANNSAFVNGVGFSAFPLMSFSMIVQAGEPSAICNYDNIASWSSRLEGILGLRIQGDDGVHYGWVRFTRPDLEPSTPFVVAGYDWNPVVGAPIEAGLPPPPPPVQVQFTDEGLSLSWDARFTGLVLEWTDSLNPPAYWQPVAGVEGSAVLLPLESAGRFYRLRRP